MTKMSGSLKVTDAVFVDVLKVNRLAGTVTLLLTTGDQPPIERTVRTDERVTIDLTLNVKD